MTKGKVFMVVGFAVTTASVLILNNTWLYLGCPFIGFGIGAFAGWLDRG